MITVLNDSKTDMIPLKMTGVKALFAGLLAVIVISIVILAYVPPVSRDALIHHLALPKLYLEHGGIYEIPSMKFSYYPMNLDILYMIPLYFGNDIIPKYIHFIFALLTAVLVFRYLRERLGDIYALLGAALFLSLPIIIKLSITVYVDLGLIFFSTAALFYLFKWMNNNYKLKHLLISAAWCGLGLGTKYNGLIVFFLLTIFVILIFAKHAADRENKQFKALGFGIVFMLVSIIVFSPWAIKNYIWTRNPVYPLYDSCFNSKRAEVADREASKTNEDQFENAETKVNLLKGGWGHFTIRKIVFKEKWWEIILIPVRIFFQGKDDHPKYFDGRLNPLLFFLPIFAFLRIKRDSSKVRLEKKVLISFSILLILYAFVQTDMRIRYISPAIPPLVVLSMFGLNDLIHLLRNRFSGNTRKIGLAGVYFSVSILLCLNASYLFHQFRYVSPLDFISGRVGRDAYIERYRPDYAAIQFANKEVPNNGIILGVFLGDRSYYSNRQMVFNFKRFLLDAFQQNFSTEVVTANLSDAGITHLIVRFDLFNQWVDNNFDDRQKGNLAQFFNTHLDLVFSKGGHGVFQLRTISTSFVRALKETC
jgi:hypothetical protein